MRAGMGAGENPGELAAGMHSHPAGRAVTDWQAGRRAVLTAVQRLDQVGVGGCRLGVPLIAAEPRIRAAVLGLLGAHGPAEDAARITVPVRFLARKISESRVPPRDGPRPARTALTGQWR